MATIAEDSIAPRRRTVEWSDPGLARNARHGLTGLQVQQGIRDGTIPATPMARMLGILCLQAEAGSIVLEMSPDESQEDGTGFLHGGAAATLLESAMGAAASTLLVDGRSSTTLDLSITYLQPLSVRSGPLRAIAVVVSSSARTVYVRGEVRDRGGHLAIHAVGNFSVLSAHRFQSELVPDDRRRSGLGATVWRWLDSLSG